MYLRTFLSIVFYLTAGEAALIARNALVYKKAICRDSAIDALRNAGLV